MKFEAREKRTSFSGEERRIVVQYEREIFEQLKSSEAANIWSEKASAYDRR
jgi:hypothetical protein